MNIKHLMTLAILGVGFSLTAEAQTPLLGGANTAQGGNTDKQAEQAWQKKETPSGRPEATQRMKDTLNSAALRNITEAEQAFCYTIESAPADFTGYTIDGMAVTGFCGMLSEPEIELFVREFLAKDENVSTVVEQCIIQPRIMLRFIRGVDFTDVLFSSPCHSFSVFYSGAINTFNASPHSAILNAVVEAYEKKKMTFVSPALLTQILPIGVPQNDEQRALVRAKSQQAPVRNWQKNDTAKAPAASGGSKPEVKGWNRLKNN